MAYLINQPLNKQLLDNIRENNMDEVIRLLKNGADINYDGGEPVYYSIKLNHDNMTKLLINMGAEINIIDYDLLSCSIGENNYGITKLLLDLDINISAGSPLFYACEEGNSEIVELLLSRGIIDNLNKNMGNSLVYLIIIQLYK
jgi:ankyrin repeat protein